MLVEAMDIGGGSEPPLESWEERAVRLAGEKRDALRENDRLRQQIHELTRRLETLERGHHRSRLRAT